MPEVLQEGATGSAADAPCLGETLPAVPLLPILDAPSGSEFLEFPVVSLPIYPELKNDSLRALLLEPQTPPPPSISWEVIKQQGVQVISQIPGSSFSTAEKDERIYPVNNYKSVMLTVYFFDFFILHSDLTVGFDKENTPFDFSIDTLPYRYEEWSSVETNVYITKELRLPRGVLLYPFAGYIFSQYYLQNEGVQLSIDNVRFQTITAGLKTAFRPARIITIDYGVFVSPIIILNYDNMLLFQFGYETAIRVQAGFATISVVLNTRNNIEYTDNFLAADTFRVSELGLRLKFAL